MNSLRRTAAVLLVLVAGSGGFLIYRFQILHRADLLRPIASTVDATPPGGDPNGAAADLPAGAQDDTGAPPADAPAHPVPTTLPDVRLPDLAGQQKALQSFLGHPLIVNFWATWCDPCRREIPLLQKLHAEHAGDQLEIVGIAVDSRGAVGDYVKKVPIHYPLLIGEQQGLDIIQQFGMQAVLPFSVFVASNGQIVALKIGELHADEAEFILAALNRIDRGSESLPAARADIAQALKTLAAQRARANAASG